jgi:hypothetical protein
MANIAILEREAKLEGKNMFMILAPRAVPLGPPKFTHVKDSAVEAAAKKDAEEEAADAARQPADDHAAGQEHQPADSPEPAASPAQAV